MARLRAPVPDQHIRIRLLARLHALQEILHMVISILLADCTVVFCALRPSGVNSYRPRSIYSLPSVPQNSMPAPVMPGTSVASNVAVRFLGYSSRTLMVSGAVRPSL